jgi:hypothetical protein
MNMVSIRQRLHSYLETADDKKVKAIYTMVEDEIEEAQVEYSDEFKKELRRRTEAMRNGTEKLISAEESDKRINDILESLPR